MRVAVPVRGALLALTLLMAATGLRAAPPGTPDIEHLLERAEHLKSSDPGQFQRLLGQLQHQRAAANPEQKERIEYLAIYNVAFQGQYEHAVIRARALMESSANPEMQFRAGVLIANLYTLDRQYTEALRELENTLGLVDRVQTAELRHQGLGVASFTYAQVGQDELALRYAERILQDTPQPRTECFAHQVKYEALQKLDRLPREDAPVLRAIRQCEAEGEVAAVNTIRVTLARKWTAEGKRDDAIALLRSHLGEIEATRFAYLISQVKALLAEWLLDEGELGAAENFANETISQSRVHENRLSLASAYRTLYRIADKRGDADQALVYFRRYAEADKAYLNEVKARELAYQMVRQETLEKSQQIQRLDSQNQLLRLQRRLEIKSVQHTRLIILLLVVLLASIAYWAYKTKRIQVSLKQLAETDALTGICNRHHFNQLAERYLQQCARNGEDAALLMFDLDHFKSINDRFGHAVGDWVLREVAGICRPFCRRIDAFGRLGGEEFALLMYGCDVRSAARLAEDCRVRISTLDTRQSGHAFTVTASFGVAGTLTAGHSLERLLTQADAQLYRAKAQGRNRVCMEEPAHSGVPSGEGSALPPEAPCRGMA